MGCMLEFLFGKVVRSCFTDFQLPISIFGGRVACIQAFVGKIVMESWRSFLVSLKIKRSNDRKDSELTNIELLKEKEITS